MRNRLSYANVTATIALFLALTGGVVWAAGKIQSSDIAKNGVKAKNLAKSSVKSRAIAKGAVKAKAIKPGAVDGSRLAAGAVGADQIAAGAVGADKLAAGAVGFGSLAPGSLFSLDATITQPVPATAAGTTPVALTGTTSFTPNAKDVYMLVTSGRGTFGDQVANQFCGMVLTFLVNGTFVEDIFLGSDGTTTLKPDLDGDEETLSLPAGQVANLTATAEVFNPACRAGSALETARVSVVRFPG